MRTEWRIFGKKKKVFFLGPKNHSKTTQKPSKKHPKNTFSWLSGRPVDVFLSIRGEGCPCMYVWQAWGSTGSVQRRRISPLATWLSWCGQVFVFFFFLWGGGCFFLPYFYLFFYHTFAFFCHFFVFPPHTFADFWVDSVCLPTPFRLTCEKNGNTFLFAVVNRSLLQRYPKTLFLLGQQFYP